MFGRRLTLSIVFLVVLTISAYILFVVIPARVAENTYDGAKAIARDFREAFRFSPEIQVNNTVILQEQKDVMELALISQRFRHEYTWTNTWMGSTKKIRITGTFEARAGFDLDRKFTVDLRGDKVFVILPHAELLSMTPGHDVVFRDESGVWNWVNEEDRSRAINAFTRDAQRASSTARFVRQAEHELERRITEMLKAHALEVAFIYEERVQKR